MCRKKGRAKNVVDGHLNEQKGPLGYQKLDLYAGNNEKKTDSKRSLSFRGT